MLIKILPFRLFRVGSHVRNPLPVRRRLLGASLAGLALASGLPRLGFADEQRYAGVESVPAPGWFAEKLPQTRWQAVNVRGGDHAIQGRHPLQQFLRVRAEQGRPGGKRLGPEDRALVGGDRRRGRQAGYLCPRGFRQTLPTGRAHLSAALRGSLVDGDPLAGLSPGGPAQAGRTMGRRSSSVSKPCSVRNRWSANAPVSR